MEELNFTSSDVITIGVFLLSVAGLYWRMQIEMRSLSARQDADTKTFNLKLAEITQSCKSKWEKHDEAQDKADAVSSAILAGISDVKGDIKSIKTHIDYLRKKGERE